MTRLIKTSVIVATILGAGLFADTAFADQTVQGGTATIEVNGTLGADNTNPDSTIPEGDDNWINVTVPTSTIFYNTPKNSAIQSPSYSITNNSGRPVSVSTDGLTTGANNSEPSDFDLTLNTVGTSTNPATTGTINLINKGSIQQSLNTTLINLANKDGKLTSNGAANAGDNSATFTYGGSSATTNMTTLKYNLGFTFKSIGW